eukprot:Phypoly_transcript_09738.p1 GENE.Phypoly_transcript_09738~~Phypoly_transcript_09738.p1  ORF type:complete len:443 (+),score=60.83 Phypoly_transcript_09738:39-1367(+)
MLHPLLRRYLITIRNQGGKIRSSCSCFAPELYNIQYLPSAFTRFTHTYKENKTQSSTNEPLSKIHKIDDTNISPQHTVTITETDLPTQPNVCTSNYPNTSSSALVMLGPMDEADEHLADMNFKAAIEKYTEAIQKNTLPYGIPLEEAYSRRAQCYHRLRRFKEAKNDCQKILDTSDKNYFLVEAYKRIGDMIIDEDQFSPHADTVSKIEAATRAVPYYHKALDILPDEEVFYALGNALLTVKQYKLAQRAFKDAIRLDPDFAPAFQGRAESFIGQEMWPQAKDDYEDFLRLQEDYFATFTPGEQVDINIKSAICHAHLQLAVINVELMEVEETKKHCEEILKIDHLYVPQAYGYLARAFFMEGKFWECIDNCNAALQRDASLFRVFKVRASAYEQLGLTSEAKADEDTFLFLSNKKHANSYKANMELQIRLQKLAENPEKIT